MLKKPKAYAYELPIEHSSAKLADQQKLANAQQRQLDASGIRIDASNNNTILHNITYGKKTPGRLTIQVQVEIFSSAISPTGMATMVSLTVTHPVWVDGDAGANYKTHLKFSSGGVTGPSRASSYEFIPHLPLPMAQPFM